MKIWVQALSFLAVAGLSFGFAAANASERVTLHLGIVTLRGISLPIVVFAAVLLGMIAVFLVGLRADLRARERLQRYRHALEDRE
ncbi:MAG: hypothetical protein V3W35_03860 [Gemmatimonadota bacterium]|nr:DUF1049 domain-containing protein [Gemmatimonadota bacterium]